MFSFISIFGRGRALEITSRSRASRQRESKRGHRKGRKRHEARQVGRGRLYAHPAGCDTVTRHQHVLYPDVCLWPAAKPAKHSVLFVYTRIICGLEATGSRNGASIQ